MVMRIAFHIVYWILHNVICLACQEKRKIISNTRGQYDSINNNITRNIGQDCEILEKRG